jgi:dTDP-4-dehydrorhamnose 3,5-epimerase
MQPSAASAWRGTPIDGVLIRTLPAHADQRGYLREIWRVSWSPTQEPFKQANLSHSAKDVLRGFHFHQRQADLWVLLNGSARATVVDLRDRLSAGSRLDTHTLTLSAGDAIFIPEGVAHGFWALEDIDLLYLVTNEYDGTDELGFAWNDVQVAAPWPGSSPRLSDRDAGNPSLAEALAGVLAANQPEPS